MNPTYDPETLAAYFQPIADDLWEDPVLGPILRHLAATDPDVLAAVADVDRSQIRDALSLSPEQRLRQASAFAAGLEDSGAGTSTVPLPRAWLRLPMDPRRGATPA
jgi:hypothetical protein